MGPYRASRLSALLVIGLTWLIGGVFPVVGETAAAPKGQLVFALDFSIAPTWFDPAETPAITTPFIFAYALHDALLKPLPGQMMAPALAESWAESADGLSSEFKLREGLNFHNGDPFTAEDVKFSFERYKGANAALLRKNMQAVEVVGPHRVRFRLTEPWPDFLAYYETPATGAGWVVPKKYLARVGDEGFKKHPIGLGPYKFVRFQPGVELVVDANEQYWRRVPSMKRLVFKMVPERATRLAMVKTGEADIGHVMFGVEAIEARQDPRLRLAVAWPSLVIYVTFPEQWDPKSPWHDRRVRLAAAHAVDKQAINEAERLGFGRLTGSIVHRIFDFALPLEPYPHNPDTAKQLLAEAGYAKGFDAGELTPVPALHTMGESVVDYLGAVGIKAKVRLLERAAFFSAWHEKKLKGLILGVAAMQGNAATVLETVAVSRGYYGITRTAATRTSMSSSGSRPPNGTVRSARRCSMRSSGASMSG